MLDVFCAVTSSRTPSLDEKGCLNSTSIYKSHELLEGETDSDRSPTNKLPDQQAADIIWY